MPKDGFTFKMAFPTLIKCEIIIIIVVYSSNFKFDYNKKKYLSPSIKFNIFR